MIAFLTELGEKFIGSSSMVILFALMLCMYFFFFRVLLRANMVKHRKMTKKERKARDKEVWSRTKKESVKAFVNWILCRCYTQEQKGELYIPFVIINYVYLIRIALFIVLWIVSAFLPTVRNLQAGIEAMMMAWLDFPVLGLETLFVFYSRFHK